MGKIIILISAAMLIMIIFPQISGTADACGLSGGHGVIGTGSGNSRPVGNQSACPGRPGSCAGEGRGRRLPDRPERDPLDKVKGSGGKAGRSGRGGKSRISGRGQRKENPGEMSERESGTGNNKKKKNRGGKGRSSEDDAIVITERPDDVPFLTAAMMRMGVHGNH